jgi:NifU-like protein involved in Fe-S cluster formation
MARYSAIAMDHFFSPRNSGALENYDVERCDATLSGQAPFMRIYLHLEGDTIQRATFVTFGCAAAIATGSMLTELIAGSAVALVVRSPEPECQPHDHLLAQAYRASLRLTTRRAGCRV